jgi:hypothetical protein
MERCKEGAERGKEGTVATRIGGNTLCTSAAMLVMLNLVVQAEESEYSPPILPPLSPCLRCSGS